MYIKELSTDSKTVTVRLEYGELCCLNNAMYQVSKFDDIEKNDNFNDVRAKITELFALVKHGQIPEFEIGWMYKMLCNPQDHPTEKVGAEEMQPTADFMEVVRCKDCRYRYSYDGFDRDSGEIYECHECREHKRDFGPNGYCSIGQRRE